MLGVRLSRRVFYWDFICFIQRARCVFSVITKGGSSFVGKRSKTVVTASLRRDLLIHKDGYSKTPFGRSKILILVIHFGQVFVSYSVFKNEKLSGQSRLSRGC